MEQIEQPGGGFRQIATGGKVGIAVDRAETDQPFAGFGVVRIEADGVRGGVMAGELPGGLDLVPRGGDDGQAGGRLDRLGGDRAGAQQADHAVSGSNNGRFNPLHRRAGIEDERNAAIEAGFHMFGARGADPPAGIGRRRGKRAARGAEQALHRGMGGAADRDRIEPGGDQRGRLATRRAGQDERERPRPEDGGQRLCHTIEAGERARGIEIGNVHDQRVETGAPLGRIDGGDRLGIRGVGGESIDRFGGDSDREARANKLRRIGNRTVSVSADNCFARRV